MVPMALLSADLRWSRRAKPSLSSALCSEARALLGILWSSLPEPALEGLTVYRGDRERGQMMGTWEQQ